MDAVLGLGVVFGSQMPRGDLPERRRQNLLWGDLGVDGLICVLPVDTGVDKLVELVSLQSGCRSIRFLLIGSDDAAIEVHRLVERLFIDEELGYRGEDVSSGSDGGVDFDPSTSLAVAAAWPTEAIRIVPVKPES